jgi:hypothetical protein
MKHNLPPRSRLLAIALLAMALAGGLWSWFRKDADNGMGDRERVPKPLPRQAATGGSNGETKVAIDDPKKTGTPIPELPDPASILSKTSLLDDGGLLTQAAVQELELSDAEQLSVQRMLLDLEAKMESLVRKNLKKDVLRSDDQKSVSAWTISSFAAEGGKAVQDFTQESQAMLGSERGSKLAAMYPVASRYGGMGRNDVRITFSAERKLPLGSTDIPCQIAQFDPATGRRLSAVYTTFDDMKFYYGNTFMTVEEDVQGK